MAATQVLGLGFQVLYIWQLISFRALTLWFIDVAVATCHIQYTFRSLWQFFSRENGQNTKILEVSHFRMIRLLGAQSINPWRFVLPIKFSV